MVTTPCHPGSRAPSRSIRWLLAAALSTLGCSHDWGAYDPRGAGPPAVSGGAGGAGGAGGMAGAGPTTTSSAGGAGGMAGAGGGGGGGSAGAGGGNPDCAPDGLLRLKDDFGDGVIDPAWIVEQYGTATVAEQGGAMAVSLPSPASGEYAGLTSSDRYDLTGCGLVARVLEVPDPGTHGFAHLFAGANGIGLVEIVKDGGLLFFKKIIGDVHTQLATTPYNEAAHAYWRIRENGGLVLWETSADAQSWDLHAMEDAPIPLTSLQIGVAAGTYQAEPTAPGAFLVDAFNVAP